MNDGVTLKDNETGKATTGGAVNIKDGTFIMNGGTISNCKTTNTSQPGTSNGGGIGGAVRVSVSASSTVNATFIMNGGTITGCSAYAGGAVAVENLKNSKKMTASFVMNGGTISDCTETGGNNGGAAVLLWNIFPSSNKTIEGATFTMNGGKIINNTGKKYGVINPGYNGLTSATAAGHIYILGGEISGNFVGNGSNNSPSSFYGNGIHLANVYSSKALLTVGGNAIIDDEVFIANKSGNYFEVLDDFTGYVKIFSQTGGNAGTYGTLVAKAVSATGVASTATQAIAGRIIPMYPYLTNQSSGERYEHPNCGVVVGTNSGEYVLGEKTQAVVEYTVTYTDGVDGEEIFADQTYTVEEGAATPAFEGTPARTGYTFTGWEPAVADTVTADVTYVAQWEQNRPAQPSLPSDSGSNVTPNLITIICDCDESHAPITYGWGDPAANSVFPNGSEPVWDEELGAWTIGVRIDSIQTYYVGLRFDKTYGGIQHVVPEEMKRIDTTLVWNPAHYGWNTLTGEPFEIHVTCQTMPEAPQMGYHLGKFQIKVVGTVNGEEKVWFEYLHADTVTVGAVKGNRVDGFTVDVTVSLADDDSYMTAWVQKHVPNANKGGYAYDWSKTEKTITFTLRYTGETSGELYDGPEYWAVDGASSRTVYLTNVVTAQPSVPMDNGGNVTPNLITIICDCDEAHAPITYGWGDPAANIVFPTGSEPVWNDELGAWTIGVRLDSIQTYYVGLRFNKVYGGIQHVVPEEMKRIDTTLVWNPAHYGWNTLTGEPFEIHVTCQTMPEAPQMGYHLSKFKIKLVGMVNGVEKVWNESLHTDTVTVGEVYGNRTEGFFVDITVKLADDDAYLASWLAKHAGSLTFAYDWTRTEQTVTFTMKYTGETSGELYDGPEYWAVSGSNVYTAYLKALGPAAPEKLGSNVTPEFVQVICDSDPIRHPAVVYQWMHQSVKVVKGAEPVWNEELGAWTIDVKLDSISVYYVLLSFDKEYGVTHELVGENYINATLKWDEAQQLWVTLDGQPIEIHVTCKTVPDAPSMMGSYQIQVKGDLDRDGIYGEDGERLTTTIPVDGCSFGEIYGSREEGFFLDVTVTLEDGDIYITNWIAQRAPGEVYVYHWDKTEKTFTFTLKYSGDLNGNLQGENDWVLATTGEIFGIVAEAFVIPAAPSKPEQKIVTDKLVAVICDADGDRHETVYAKWYPNHCKTTSDIVWNEELGTYTVDIRIGSLSIMYVNQLEDANNGTSHNLVEDITSVTATLKWDYEQNLWVTLDGQPIELHTACRTAPLAPEYKQVDGYQIKVWGDVNGTETAFTTNLPEGGYTLSEVRGSREEGFFVDVVITLKDGDIFITNWMEKKVNPGITYVYDTERTEMTITITLRYNGDLNGTLYGNRHAANTNYDWVLDTNGKTFGVIAEAYVVHHHVPGDPANCIDAQLCKECGAVLVLSAKDALAEAVAALEEAIAAGDEVRIAELEKLVEELTAALATSHNREVVVLKAPTTNLVGKLESVCARCGEQETVELPVLSTTAYNYEEVLASTATADGIGRYTWNETLYGNIAFDVVLRHELAETDAQIVIKSGMALMGDVLRVEVVLKNNPGVQGILAQLQYNESVMTLVNVENGVVLENLNAEGHLLWTGAADSMEDGVLCVLEFRIAEHAPVGRYPIGLILEEVRNANEEPVQIHVVFGTALISDVIYGDVTDDGKTSLSDVLRLRKYLAARNPSSNESTVIIGDGADVNGDGKVNLQDMLLLRQYLANRDPKTGESTVEIGPL